MKVNIYSRLIAATLGMDKDFCERIGQVASIHDIGKVSIPHILKLNRPLNETEYAEMTSHTVYGGLMIQQMFSEVDERDLTLEMACTIALCHHQKWDGSGYPKMVTKQGEVLDAGQLENLQSTELRPLKETEIPIECRIVSLADVYDALRSVRPYKRAFSHDEACVIIARDDRTGKYGEDFFGPDLMEIFAAIHLQFRDIHAELSEYNII